MPDDRLLVLATTAAGAVIAVVVTLLLPSVYSADASIALVRQGQPPGSDPVLASAAVATSELLHSRAVAQSAAANLRLDESPEDLLDRVEVETEPESSLVRLVVEAPSADEARRTAQELAEVSTVLFNDRFAPQTSATIWEPARAEEDRVAPKPARNLALGALFGALVGWALVARSRSRPGDVSESSPRQVTIDTQPIEPETAARPAPPPPPAVIPEEPEPEPTPVPVPVPAEPERPGEWTIASIERLLAEQGDAFPDRREELGFYLESFRDVADPNGRLPAGVMAVIDDVFRELIETVCPLTRSDSQPDCLTPSVPPPIVESRSSAAS